MIIMSKTVLKIILNDKCFMHHLKSLIKHLSLSLYQRTVMFILNLTLFVKPFSKGNF